MPYVLSVDYAYTRRVRCAPDNSSIGIIYWGGSRHRVGYQLVYFDNPPYIVCVDIHYEPNYEDPTDQERAALPQQIADYASVVRALEA